jgi:hypothetical protein
MNMCVYDVLFFDSHQTTHQSNTGVRLRKSKRMTPTVTLLLYHRHHRQYEAKSRAELTWLYTYPWRKLMSKHWKGRPPHKTLPCVPPHAVTITSNSSQTGTWDLFEPGQSPTKPTYSSWAPTNVVAQWSGSSKTSSLCRFVVTSSPQILKWIFYN